MKAIITGIGLVAGLNITAEQNTKTVEDMLKNGYDIIDIAKTGLRFKIADYKNKKDSYKNFEDYSRANADIDKKIIITFDDGTTVSLYGLLSQLSNGTLNPLHTQIVANHYEIDVVSFEEFKSMYERSTNGYLNILAHISRLDYVGYAISERNLDDIMGIYAEVDNKQKTKMYIQTDGATNTKYRKNITIAEMAAGAKYHYKKSRLHFKANCSGLFENSNVGTISIERMLAGLHNAGQNRLLKNYINYEANVMDCSANPDTAKKINIEPFNFSLNNIEWCSSDDNKKHMGKIDKINKKYNRVYAISALDPLWDLDSEWITLTHLDTYYRRIK
jgi:hypothetical protein